MVSFHYSTNKKWLFGEARLYSHTFLCNFVRENRKKTSVPRPHRRTATIYASFLDFYAISFHLSVPKVYLRPPFSFAVIHIFSLETSHISRYNGVVHPENEFYTQNDYLYDYEKKSKFHLKSHLPSRPRHENTVCHRHASGRSAASLPDA